MWTLERNSHILVQHLQGALNSLDDAESWSMKDRSDRRLDTAIFRRINHPWGPIEVDFFASRLTPQCQAYYSWRPDPYALATDAFKQD